MRVPIRTMKTGSPIQVGIEICTYTYVCILSNVCMYIY